MLLIVLALLITGIAYYKLIYTTVVEHEIQLEEQLELMQTQLENVEASLTQLKRMEDELAQLGEGTSRVESYNNAKEELARLNRALQKADAYTVSFSNVTRQGDLIRRNFSLAFTAGSFDTVKQIVTELVDCDYRCLIGDIQYSSNHGAASVSLNATFFETMVGGTADAGLPAAE